MAEAVFQNLRDSAYDFKRVVWPEIREYVGGGDLYPVEAVTDAMFARVLDLQAGIDAWHWAEGGLLRGIASRVQYGSRAYQSFTVRSALASGLDTELQKRTKALADPDGGWVVPKFTVQAYVSSRRTGEPIYICLVDTRDLFAYLNEYPHELATRRAGGNEFKVAWVERLLDAGVEVEEWDFELGDLIPAPERDIAFELPDFIDDPQDEYCVYCGGHVQDDWCLSCGRGAW